MEDTITAYTWLKNKFASQERPEGYPILVFAHSLGAAIASHALSNLSAQEELTNLTGLILMAPFNNFTDEFIHMTNIYLPRAVVQFFLKLINMEYRYESSNINNCQEQRIILSSQDEHLAQVPCPVLVLHAEDDPKIPVSLARALVQEVRGAGKEDISIEVAPASLGYAHNQVCYTFSRLWQLYTYFYTFSECSGVQIGKLQQGYLQLLPQKFEPQ